MAMIFQSTLPACGETRHAVSYCTSHRDFNPLSPHGERPKRVSTVLISIISIHSPRMGRDRARESAHGQRAHFNPLSPHGERPITPAARSSGPYFNPLSPHGERHHRGDVQTQARDFNPLSPHGERPSWGARFGHGNTDFNPLSPHGERPKHVIVVKLGMQFQSTLPAWGETLSVRARARASLISIHSPRMGRDPRGQNPNSLANLFQSTLPAWGETRPLRPNWF